METLLERDYTDLETLDASYPEQLLEAGQQAYADVSKAITAVTELGAVEGTLVEVRQMPELFTEGGIKETNLTPMVSDCEQVVIYAKQETEQSVGAFKIRGAFVACWQALRKDPNVRHLVTNSAGNHGKGVAAFARWYNQLPVIDRYGVSRPRTADEYITAQVFCKESASPPKVSDMKELGADVHQKGPDGKELKELEDAAKAAKATVNRINDDETTERAFFVPPFDHPDVMAGQSTILLETVMQIQAEDVDLRSKPLVLHVAWGGGGLGCGNAVLMDHLVEAGVLHPDSRVVATQMEGCDSIVRALELIDTGKAESAGDLTSLFEDADGEDAFDPSADGTAVRQVGGLNLPLAYYLRARGRLQLMRVSKPEVGKSMLRAQYRGQKLEPAGALADAGRSVLMRRSAAYYVSHPEAEELHVVVESGANVAQETTDDFVAASMDGHPFGGMAMRVASSPTAH